MKLQIWWIIGRHFGQNHSFTQEVQDEFEAGMLLEALTNFDLELGDIVSSNAGGLNEWDEMEWTDYYDSDGWDFNLIMTENQSDDPSYYVPETSEQFKLVCQILARYAKYVFDD